MQFSLRYKNLLDEFVEKSKVILASQQTLSLLIFRFESMESFRQPLSSLPAQLLWHVAGGFRKPASSLSFPVLSRFEIIWKAT